MKEVKKIVFATDFSETSRKAEDIAKTLRDNLGAELYVVHIFDPTTFEMPAPYFFMPGATSWLQERLTEMQGKGREHLEEYAQALGVSHSAFIEGKAGPSLVEFAEERSIDLIIMGTHGHSGLTRLMMGSVAEYVMRHTKIPVLTVKPD